MKKIILLTIILWAGHIHAQYQFESVKTIHCTPVKSQDRTGTCWSFATASFLESELIRMGKGAHNLSEMYVVRNIYRDKARNYVLRQGKANFSQGSLAHDLIRAFERHGALPETAYPGKSHDETKHNHSEMEAVLKGMLDGLIKSKELSPKWSQAIESVLDVYLGPVPEKFNVDGKVMDQSQYTLSLGIDANDYVSITSFTHHPFYSEFILEIPDNYSNGSFHNVPLNELSEIMHNALDNGYSITWDGDVSEKGFSGRQGLAVLPSDEKRDDLFETPGEEKIVTQISRQANFESYSTTDDHLMHFVGKAKDQNGKVYFLVKNSWGEISDYKGYLYMSENYAMSKTISILVHKDAIPTEIRKKIGL